MPNYQERLRQLTRALRAARLELAEELARLADAKSGTDVNEKMVKRSADGKNVQDCTKIKLRRGHSSSRKVTR